MEGEGVWSWGLRSAEVGWGMRGIGGEGGGGQAWTFTMLRHQSGGLHCEQLTPTSPQADFQLVPLHVDELAQGRGEKLGCPPLEHLPTTLAAPSGSPIMVLYW